MKLLLIPILLAELFIAYFFLAPTCIYRPETARAFVAWHQNPTPETRAAFHKQRRIANLQDLGVSAFFFSIMAGVTILAFHKWTRPQNQTASSVKAALPLLIALLVLAGCATKKPYVIVCGSESTLPIETQARLFNVIQAARLLLESDPEAAASMCEAVLHEDPDSQAAKYYLALALEHASARETGTPH